MDQMEMVEKLREKAGCSFADAKDALERSDWVLLDAMILLEREKKTARHTAKASTEQKGNDYQTVLPVVASQKKTQEDSFIDKLKDLWNKGLTHSLVIRREEQELARIPITLFLILLCASFYVIIIACLIALFCGCKLSFEGPGIKKDAEINRVMQDAADAAEKMKNEFKDKD